MFKRLGSAAVCAVLFSLLWNCASTPRKNEETLHELIRKGRNEEAKERLTALSGINETDDDGNTALHLAASADNGDMVLFLLEKGADTNAKNNCGQTPLHLAVENNSLQSAKHLVSFGTDIFSRNDDGISPLEAGFSRSSDYYSIFITEKNAEQQDRQTGRTIVHYCAVTQNAEALQICIQKRLPLSMQDKDGQTPLNLAFDTIKAGTADIAALLILNGGKGACGVYEYFQTAILNRNVDYRFDDGQTPLHIAAAYGHEEIVRYLLVHDADAGAQDASGSTALHEAVRTGNSVIAQQLLEAGADANAKDALGKTPLLLVIPEKCRRELYELLIMYKADVLQKDTYGDTVFHSATMTRAPLGILHTLSVAGADVNARNKEGITPLALAIRSAIPEHVSFYVEHGADIHSKDTNGRTPLITALLSKDAPLELLLTKRTIESRDAAGNTPLLAAVMFDAPSQKIRRILDMTSDVNARNADGNTALYLAVIKNRRKVGEMLLAKGADMFSANNKSRSPLSLALHSDSEVIEWLINSRTIQETDGSGNSAVHYAAEWGLENAVRILTVKGADANARNANGETPLFSAAKSDNSVVINEFVKRGSDMYARDNLGATPLHAAIRRNNKNTAATLIKLGADVNAQNTVGKSPLAEAVLLDKTDVCTLLLDGGADVNAGDKAGKTVLIDAIAAKNVNAVRLLLSYGANPEIQDVNGRNACHEVALSASIDIIEAVRDAGGSPLLRDKNGETPFSLSFVHGYAVTAVVLGTDKTISDSDGNTPIHILAARLKRPDILASLLQDGWQFDARNAAGFTPLALAVDAGAKTEAQLLLEHGANPFIVIDKKGRNAASLTLEQKNAAILADMAHCVGNKTDIQGNTLLHYAAKGADAEVIKMLLSAGLNPSVKNIAGETPYMTAVRWKRTEAVELLTPKSTN